MIAANDNEPLPPAGRGYVILLCNLTLAMAEPWIEAGYHVVMVDPQHPISSTEDGVTRLSATIVEAADALGAFLRSKLVAFVAGFPPCTDVAVSGSKHFAAKRAKDPHFQAKAALVAEQCRMVGLLAGCPWFFENPVSVFSSIFGSAQHSFHPWHFSLLCPDDNYTKNTQIWAGGGFYMPPRQVRPETLEAIELVRRAFGGRMPPKPKALEIAGNTDFVRNWYPDDRIHKAPPGPDRANFRSATPRGFARAVFLGNAPHLRAANDNYPASPDCLRA